MQHFPEERLFSFEESVRLEVRFSIAPMFTNTVWCVCVHVCIYIHTYTHTYIHTYIQTDRQTDNADTHMYVYISVYTYMCTYASICVYICMLMYTHVHTYTWMVCMLWVSSAKDFVEKNRISPKIGGSGARSVSFVERAS